VNFLTHILIDIARYYYHIKYLECFHRTDAILVTLVVIARKRTFQYSTRVCKVIRLLDCNVAPVRHLNHPRHLCHCQEWRVVLNVNHQLRLQQSAL